MARERERPGVMLYFDIRPALERLTNEQRGALLYAIFDYAEFGNMPELDNLTGIVFDLLAPRIDRDAARYEEKRTKARYSAYCKGCAEADKKPLSFEDWQAQIVQIRPPPCSGR